MTIIQKVIQGMIFKKELGNSEYSASFFSFTWSRYILPATRVSFFNPYTYKSYIKFCKISFFSLLLLNVFSTQYFSPCTDYDDDLLANNYSEVSGLRTYNWGGFYNEDNTIDELPGAAYDKDIGVFHNDVNMVFDSILNQGYDLALTKHLAESGLFFPGDTVSFVIRVYNQGSIDANNITVLDSIPIETSLVLGGDFTAITSDSAVANISNIQAGEVDSVMIDLIISPTTQATDFINVAAIAADDGDDVDSTPNLDDGPDINDDPIDSADDEDFELVSISHTFDLAVQKLVVGVPSGKIPGDTIDFEITVYNQGTVPVLDIEVEDHIPTGMNYISSPDFQLESSRYIDTIYSLQPGASALMTIRLEIDSSFQGDSLINNVEITAVSNDYGLIDEDDVIDGTAGILPAELDTDNDTNDNPDNPIDIDHYDPALVLTTQTFDLALTKHLAENGPFSTGDTVSYVIYVYNQGSLDAIDIVVEDVMPMGMSLVTGGDFVEITPDSVVTVIPNIPSGQIDSIHIDLMIDSLFQGDFLINTAEIISDNGDDTDSTPDSNGATGPDNDINATNGTDDIDSESINVTQSFDLALQKLAVGNSSGLAPGDTVEFEVIVYNQGTLTASDIVVEDYIPTGLNFVQSSDFMDQAGDYLSTISNISPEASDTLHITLEIDSLYQGDSIVNSAEIISANNSLNIDDEDDVINGTYGSIDDTSELSTDNEIDDNPDDTNDVDHYDPELITVSQSYDLALTKSLGSAQVDTVAPGDTVSFEITVYNQGTLPVDSLVLVDYVDTTMWKPFDDILNGGWTYIADDTARFNTTIGLPLLSGDSISILVSQVVRDDYTGLLTNTAEIWADNGDDRDSETEDAESDGDNDITIDDIIDNTGSDEDDEDIAQLESSAYDLALVKIRQGTGPVDAGEFITFKIYVYNQGSIDAENVTIADYVPQGLLYGDINWNSDSTYTFPSIIPAGGVDSINLDLRVDPAFQGVILTNNAEIISDNGDDIDSDPASEDGSVPDDLDNDITETNGDDDYDFETIIVNQDYDLALRKELAVGQFNDVSPGDTVSFTITVFNQGTVSANTLEIVDYVDTTQWKPFDISLNSGWTVLVPDSIKLDIIAVNGGNPLLPDAQLSYDISLVVRDDYTGTVVNTAEILTDDGNDLDSDTEDIENDRDADPTIDNEINNSLGDEDDEDIATVQSSVYDLALIKQLAPGQDSVVQPGDTLDFIITIINQGSVEGGFIQVVDYIDTSYFNPVNLGINPGWSYLNFDLAQYTIFDSGLQSGDSLHLNFSVITRADFLGTAINYAEIRADAALDIDSSPEVDQDNGTLDTTLDDVTDNTGGDEDDLDIAIVAVNPFDLALTKSLVDSGPFHPGDTATFRIYVYNQGLIDATDVVVEDYIPTSMTLVDPDWMGSNTYTFDRLNAGDVDSIDIDLRISPTATDSLITNNAEIVSATGGNDLDSNQGDNEGDAPELSTDDKILDAQSGSLQDDDPDQDDYDPAQIEVIQTFDLALNKVVVNDKTYVPGDTVDFRIYVHNQGTLPASSVTVKDYIPVGFQLVDFSWPFDSSYTFFSTIEPGTIDSVDIALRIDPSFSGDFLVNNAEIVFALGGTDADSSPGNNQGQPGELSEDNTITDIQTGELQDDDPFEDDYDPALVRVNRYDLALKKVVDSNNSGPYSLFDTIPFLITVYNQGNVTIGEFTISDYVPSGLTISSADALWSEVNDSLLRYTSSSHLNSGDSLVVPLLMALDLDAYTLGLNDYVNVAEISDMKDTLGFSINDLDSYHDENPNNDIGGEVNSPTDNEIFDNNTIDEDDSDPAQVSSLEIDPTGYIYCEKTGEIITGGQVVVSGPGNVIFGVDSLGNLIDGRNGYYQFVVDAIGDYSITYVHPDGYPLSVTCLPFTSLFNPGGLDGTPFDKDGVTNNVLVMGSDSMSNSLIDTSCAYNNYFLNVTLDPSAPYLIANNNLPVQCILISNNTCHDVNSDGSIDSGIDSSYEGAMVFLHYCGDTITPLDSMQTGADGLFTFARLIDTCYRLKFNVPDDHFISISDNVDSLTGWSSPIDLAFGECDTTTTICIAPCNVSCDAISSDPTTCASNDGQIVVNASGGLTNYRYSIDGITYQSSNTFTNLTPGTYTVTVIDATGCESQSTATLQLPSGISCSVISIDPTCSTELGMLVVSGSQGSGLYEYSLDGNSFQSLDTFYNVTEGLHTVRVRDAADTTCLSICSGTITIPTALTCTLFTNHPTCNGGTGTVSVIPSGGSGSYEYSLDGSVYQADSIFTSVSSGSQTVIVRDVADTTCVTLRTTTLIPPVALSCNALPSHPTCTGGFGSIVVSGLGGSGAYQYSINNGTYQDSTIFETLLAGTYIITVRDSADISCVSTCTVTLNDPLQLSCSISAFDPTCSISTGSIVAQGVGGSGTYEYSIDGVVFQSNDTFPSLATGNYTITTRDVTDTTCVITCGTSISAHIPITCSTSITNATCSTGSGSIVVAGVGGSNDYEFSIDGVLFQSSNQFESVGIGTHTITVRDAIDVMCISTCTAEVVGPPAISCSATGNNPTCFDDLGVVTISANGGNGTYTYQLDNGAIQNLNTFSDVSAGLHTITVLDRLDTTCTSTCTVTISIPDTLTCSFIVNNPTCSDGLGEITAIGVGGSGNYVYALDEGSLQSLSTFTNVDTGVHVISVMDQLDNSCVSMCSARIDAPAPIVCTTSVSNPTCNAALGSITVTAIGGSGNYEYRLGAGPYQLTNTFENLADGAYSITVRDINDANCTTTCAATVESPTVLTCNAIATSPTCGDDLGSILVSVSGGSGSYEYSIDNISFGSSEEFINLGTGSYTVYIRDAIDITCMTTCTADIIVPNTLTCSTSVIDPVCSGGTGTITVNATGGNGSYEYSLDGVAFGTSNVFSDVASGSHTVIVRDAVDNSCTTDCIAIITNPAPLSCSVSQLDPTCNMPTGTLVISATGGSGTFQYSINGGSFVDDNTFNGLSAGAHLVTVRDANSNTCSTTCSATINAFIPLTCEIIKEDAECGDELGEIEVTASGGSGVYEYSLNGGAYSSQNTFADLSAGSYTVAVRDLNDLTCVSTCIETIVVPPLLSCVANNINPDCSDELGGMSVTVSNSNNPYTISWDLVGGGTPGSDVSSAATYDISSLSEGTLGILITDAEGCQTECSSSISIPSSFSCTAVAENPECSYENGSIIVSINGPMDSYSITWQAQGGGPVFNQIGVVDEFTISNLEDDLWNITVINSNLCESTCSAIIASPDAIICEVNDIEHVSCNGRNDGSVRIQADSESGGIIYSITGVGSNGDGDFSDLPAGSYTAVVTDLNGCESTCEFTIAEPSILTCTANIIQEITCEGGEIGEVAVSTSGGVGPYTYTLDGETNVSGVFDNLGLGSYDIEVTDINGCITSCSVILVSPDIDLICDIDLLSSPTCSGASDARIRVRGSGGLAPYTYKIGGEINNTGTFNSLSAGLWNVFVYDAEGCASFCTIRIDEPNSMSCAVEVTDPLSCRDASDARVRVNVTGGAPPYSYSRNGMTFQSSPTFSNISSGVSFIEVRDKDGCFTLCQVYIPNPPEFFCLLGNIGQISCAGASDAHFQATGHEGVEPYRYSINGSPFLEINEWSSLSPGEYVITVMDAQGCQSSCDFLFLDPPPITCTLLDIEHPECDASNGSFVIDAVGGVGRLSYQINGGPFQVSSKFDNLPAGNYTIGIQDQGGCIVECTTINLNGNGLTCEADILRGTICRSNNTSASIQVRTRGGQEPIEYLLDSGAFGSSSSFHDVTDGMHTVTVRDANGCISSCSIEIFTPEMMECHIEDITDASCDNPNRGDVEITADGGILPYTYTLSNGQISNDGYFDGLNAGDYSIEVSDLNGCTSQCTFTIGLEASASSAHINCISSFEFLGCNPRSIPPAEEYISNGVITSDDGMVIVVSENESIDGCIHTMVYTYRAIDPCGNESTESCTYTLEWKVDTIAPEMPIIQEEIEANCAPEDGIALSAIDNCGEEITTLPQDQLIENGDCKNQYTLLRTWTFVDDCGNDAVLTQTIIVSDEDAPTFINVPQDIEVNSVDQVPDAPILVADDNCSDDVNIQFSESTEGRGCSEVHIIRTWVASDVCGNTISHIQTITIRNESEVECEVTNIIDSSCDTDNGSIELILSNTGSGTYRVNVNGVLVSPGLISGLAPDSYNISIEDENGCEVSTCSFIIMGENDVSPELVCDISDEELDLGCNPTIIPSAQSLIDDGFLSVSDQATIGLELEESTIDRCEHSITYGFRAFSECGTPSIEMCMITYVWTEDTQAPVISTVLEDITIIDEADMPEVPTINVSDHCAEISEDYSETSENNDCGYTLTRRWSYTDNCGNMDSLIQVITVENCPVDTQLVDLALAKVVDESSVEVGDMVTFTITVINQGEHTATGITVADHIPDGLNSIAHISDNGLEQSGDVIWTDLTLDVGESIDLTMAVTMTESMVGKSFNNTAEIMASDQNDIDSDYGNDDGDQSEDDESSASVIVVSDQVGFVSDLELDKRIIDTDAQIGDTITFEIQLFNQGPDPVSFAEVEDIIPNGYVDYLNISHEGVIANNVIRWGVRDLGAGESIVFSFDTRVVHCADQNCDYRNRAQVVTSTSLDPDSTPGNDDGDSSEDDEDWTEVFDQVDDNCVSIDAHVFLEGAFDYSTGLMHTMLNDLGYLPGQDPVTFFGKRTSAGHPYTIAPWSYNGDEGDLLDSNFPTVDDLGDYPEDAVDYVLVGLRTDLSFGSTVCERAALVLRDGSIYFFEDDSCCDLDMDTTYYIVIEHRNHLPVMSHEKVGIINNTMIYDFRAQDSYSSALGFGQKKTPDLRWMMYAANGDQTLSTSSREDINIRDLNIWLKDDGKNSGYFLRDYDLNGDVNVKDKALFLRNNGVFTDVRVE